MKKSIYIGILSVVLSLAVSPVVFAEITGVTNPPTVDKPLEGWLGIVNTIAKWFYTLILVISVIMILMAAFNYLTAGGDQGKVKKASQMLIYAVVGIVVAILAFSISSIVTGIVK